MKFGWTSLLLVVFINLALGQVRYQKESEYPVSQVLVQGYRKKDGTYVREHWRNPPRRAPRLFKTPKLKKRTTSKRNVLTIPSLKTAHKS